MEASYAARLLGDSPQMKERYNESVFGMIRRDRNHPSVTIWGLLNETSDGPIFRHAVQVLPELRKLDNTRVVMLNSGQFDNASGIAGIQAWHDDVGTNPCVTRNSSDHGRIRCQEPISGTLMQESRFSFPDTFFLLTPFSC